MTSQARVALSTSSVYPETTAAGFELAGRLGYDGVEVMVGIDPVASDISAVRKLQDFHQVPVLAVHAPTLLLTQRTWGGPWEKLEKSADMARELGADVVVVHPPFVWQRDYAAGFQAGIKRLNAETGVKFCVENMYPWRSPAGEIKAYRPGWDPSPHDFDNLTLDLSHASTSRVQSLDYVHQWGDRLQHLHLTDGSGGAGDEHLVPGRGDQRAAEVLQALAHNGYRGHVVLEVNTRKARDRSARERDLYESLSFARTHLAVGSDG